MRLGGACGLGRWAYGRGEGNGCGGYGIKMAVVGAGRMVQGYGFGRDLGVKAVGEGLIQKW